MQCFRRGETVYVVGDDFVSLAESASVAVPAASALGQSLLAGGLEALPLENVWALHAQLHPTAARTGPAAETLRLLALPPAAWEGFYQVEQGALPRVLAALLDDLLALGTAHAYLTARAQGAAVGEAGYAALRARAALRVMTGDLHPERDGFGF